jgi:3'-phosphoadenosine 5'-phosphosulfate sulfotransferase (PAPS reductase)/FAD synthetase
MDIDFTSDYVVNDNDVTFFAIVDNQTVACIVTTAALEELTSSDDEDDVETLFLDHQYKFEEIAEGMIRNHQAVDGEVHITSTELL